MPHLHKAEKRYNKWGFKRFNSAFVKVCYAFAVNIFRCINPPLLITGVCHQWQAWFLFNLNSEIYKLPLYLLTLLFYLSPTSMSGTFRL